MEWEEVEVMEKVVGEEEEGGGRMEQEEQDERLHRAPVVTRT